MVDILIRIIFEPVPDVESIIRDVFENFNFHNEAGLLQYWACIIDPDSEDIVCNLVLTDINRNSTQDEGLEDYRNRCLQNPNYPSVGIETSVGNWLAGRSAQTLIADHKTTHHVLVQHDQHSDDVGPRGQLVLPVFYTDGSGIKPAGIIEFVTPVPKECYAVDFELIHDLLKDEGLESTYMGKTIKVEYNGTIIRFALSLSAIFADLHKEVTMRFPELQSQIYRVEYNNTESIRQPISGDDDLRICMVRSSSTGQKFIRMFVFVEHGVEATKGLIRKSYGTAANTELLQV